MGLFTMKEWGVEVSEETWRLKPFKAILDRDKTKEKEVAHAEVTFAWFWTNIKSDYLSMNEEDRLIELKKDVQGLPDGWEPDELVFDVIKYFNKFESVIERLYKQTLKSVYDIGDYLANTKDLLDERDDRGKPVYDVAKISSTLNRVPKIMSDLKEAYKEVIKEQLDNEGKSKGAQRYNTYEEGLTID